MKNSVLNLNTEMEAMLWSVAEAVEVDDLCLRSSGIDELS